jgi:hypothetical protein
MLINDRLTHFGGKKIKNWQPGKPLPDPATSIPFIGFEWEQSDAGDVALRDWIMEFLELPNVSEVTGMVIGMWEGSWDSTNSATIVETLVAASEQLPNLTALFMGEILQEESEISWIQQSDMAPLFGAYPKLTHFGVRGGTGLSLGVIQHNALQELVVQTGGMSRQILLDLGESPLPALEHLELWLGDDGYGWDGTIEDVKALLKPANFPALTYLGLRNSMISDEIAEVIALHPILKQVKILDLSLGTIADAGGQALLNSPYLPQLQELRLSHHYFSDEMVAKLEALTVKVDVSDPQKGDNDGGRVWRYVAVSE